MESAGTAVSYYNDKLELDAEDADCISVHSFQSSDDEDGSFFQSFDYSAAQFQLFNSIESTQIILDSNIQLDLGIQVGVNVTGQYPWKLIPKEVLEVNLVGKSQRLEELRQKIVPLPENTTVLVGYAAAESENSDQDTFVVYLNDESKERAMTLIKQTELWDRKKTDKALFKYSKPWQGLGSEKEIELAKADQKKSTIVDVEVQSAYPIRGLSKPIQLTARLAEDIRDGFVEFKSAGNRFENIHRNRIDVGVQSAPPRVHLEQQTDPAFPTNAWSQYLYEILPEENKVEDNSVVKTDDTTYDTATSCDIISNQTKELLTALEFNQIDMYKNDYHLLKKNTITNTSVPSIIEVFCFVDIAKTAGRCVCSLEWHPTLSDIFVASYTWATLGTTVKIDESTDKVNRTVLQSNPVLMWSLNNTLKPKLEFYAPREVTALSFCPYDDSLLVGGLSSGQLIIWDYKACIDNVETEEVLTIEQLKNRKHMHSFLDWTIRVTPDSVVEPAAVSSLDHSHQAFITGIKWLNQMHSVTETGTFRMNTEKNYRFIVTFSIDGTLAFWNIDLSAARQQGGRVKSANQSANQNLPAELLEKVSPYKIFDRLLKPTFMLIYKEPISMIVLNDGVFRHEIIEQTNINKDTSYDRIEAQIVCIDQPVPATQLIACTLLGNLVNIHWHGLDTESNAEVPQENINEFDSYALVHNGPILDLQRNPFVPDLFLTIGGHILALWKENELEMALLWRKRPSRLTCCRWSKDRPAVFFLTRVDGTIEAWDLLSSTEEPCYEKCLGGNILTVLAQNALTTPATLIAIGDCHSTLRMLKLPLVFMQALHDEANLLKHFIDKEMRRKRYQKDWQAKWRDENKDIIEARRLTAREALADLATLQKSAFKDRDASQKIDDNNTKNVDQKKGKKIFDLPERLARKWDEMNIKRLMQKLMEIKMVDPETLEIEARPEKERRSYDALKKKVIKEAFEKIYEDLAEVRARLLPATEENFNQADLINSTVSAIIAKSEDYATIERRAMAQIMEEQNTDSVLHTALSAE